MHMPQSRSMRRFSQGAMEYSIIQRAHAKAGGYCLSQTGLGWGWLPRGRTSPTVALVRGMWRRICTVCNLRCAIPATGVFFFFRAKIILGQPILLFGTTTEYTHPSLLSLLTRISYRLKQEIISKHSISGNLPPLLQSNPSNFQDRDLFQA